MHRVLAAFGDPTSINCWSNIPYFFLAAGQRAGFLHGGLPLKISAIRRHRWWWNLQSPLRLERPGGFQYLRFCQEEFFRQANVEGIDEIVSHFQLFPPYEMAQDAGIAFYPYIDFPLSCLFDDYGINHTIGHRTARTALAREKEQYRVAKRVICMSPWAVRQVVERCGIPADHVRYVIPGANLPEHLIASPETLAEPTFIPPDGKTRPLRIIFIGKDWRRKGLTRLVSAVRLLKQRGFQSILRVIGPTRNPFPNEPSVEHLGFIDKALEPLRLIQELRSCHLGALPSYQEAFGIAALEYLRCGLPSLLTKVGGLQDSVPSDCAHYLEVNCTGEEIADTLEDMLRNPERLINMQARAIAQGAYASWDRAAGDFADVIADCNRSRADKA